MKSTRSAAATSFGHFSHAAWVNPAWTARPLMNMSRRSHLLQMQRRTRRQRSLLHQWESEPTQAKTLPSLFMDSSLEVTERKSISFWAMRQAILGFDGALVSTMRAIRFESSLTAWVPMPKKEDSSTSTETSNGMCVISSFEFESAMSTRPGTTGISDASWTIIHK